MSRPSPVLAVINEYMQANKTLIASAEKRNEKARREWLKAQEDNGIIDWKDMMIAMEIANLKRARSAARAAAAFKRHNEA